MADQPRLASRTEARGLMLAGRRRAERLSNARHRVAGADLRSDQIETIAVRPDIQPTPLRRRGSGNAP